MSKKRSPVLKNLDDYILVTRKNMKLAIGAGDHFFIIDRKTDKFEITGNGDIVPRLKKGWWTATGMPHGVNNYISFEFFVDDEKSPTEYKDGFGPIFHYVDAGRMYVHKTERRKTIYTMKGETAMNITQRAPQLLVPVVQKQKEIQVDFLNL
jgi:hypothetical protein